jgi:predicted amidohydrolase
MNLRLALANIRPPRSPEDSVALAVRAIEEAGAKEARLLCFPECFIPGYRVTGKAADPSFLQDAWATVAAAAARADLGVILGTERVVDGVAHISALVVQRDGSIAGFQDKVQLDPSEDGIYQPGSGRRVFEADGVTFGVVICHEGWRYPETVRFAVRSGAQIVFHPHYDWGEPGMHLPTIFADPAGTFHEKAALCRAAENTCYFATVNYAVPNAQTTSAVVRPDGSLLCYQPRGEAGLLVADVDPALATGLLARRYRPIEVPGVATV